LLSFFEIIIFNEEILLTLCFLSFLFYAFNSLSDSVFSSFEQRASKFEQDLLFSFTVSKSALISDFSSYLKLRMFMDQITILMLSLLNFLSKSVTALAYKPN
jgi:hypothetical protein